MKERSYWNYTYVHQILIPFCFGTLCMLARRDVIIPLEALPNRHAPQAEVKHRRLTPNQLHNSRPLLPSADSRSPSADIYISNCWHQGIPLGSALVCANIEDAILTLTITGWSNKCWFASYAGKVHRISHTELGNGLMYESSWFRLEPAFFYYWTYFTPTKWEPWKRQCLSFLRTLGVSTPVHWLENPSGESASTEGSLRNAYQVRLSKSTSTEKTMKNPSLKYIWWCAIFNKRDLFSDDTICLYMQFLDARDNLGCITASVQGILFLKRHNPNIPRMSALLSDKNGHFLLPPMANALRKTFQQQHKSAPVDTPGIEPWMAADILHTYVYLFDARIVKDAWALCVGIAISTVRKLCMRWDCASRLRYDDDWFVVHDSHIKLYIDGGKTSQYQGRWADVARSEDPDILMDTYTALLIGKKIFKRGFILAKIMPQNKLGFRVVDSSKQMSRDDFVAFTRSALQAIGIPSDLSNLFTAKSCRIGAASAAVVAQLSLADIATLSRTTGQCWVSWYDKKSLAERLRISRAIGC